MRERKGGGGDQPHSTHHIVSPQYLFLIPAMLVVWSLLLLVVHITSFDGKPGFNGTLRAHVFGLHSLRQP